MAEDFFAQETRTASKAIRALLKQTGERIAEDTDIRPLIRKRPWTSLLATFSGGIVSGYLLAPRRKSPAEKAEKAAKKEAKKVAQALEPHGGTTHRLQEHLMRSLAPAIGAFASSAAAALFHHHEQPGNGHHPAAIHDNGHHDPSPFSEP